MFIAHLPAGYLAANTVANSRPTLFIATMVGSILPDIDMLYFYLIDMRQTPHHAYFSHWPLLWVLVGLLGILVLLANWRMGTIAIGLSVGGILHTTLDSIASPIYWLKPFSNFSFELVSVPAIHSSWWVWNFILHWTFAMEITICLTACIVWLRPRFNR